ncbi:MAG: tetratricopeptide repeat-containing sulfotransferase family protein [Gammaproteobacteria bacterium]
MDNGRKAEAQLRAGLEARARGELAGAQALFESALAADPRLGHAHSALAAVLIARGRHNQAVPHVEAALESNPDDATALHCLGLLFLERALFEPAMAAFEHCLRIDPAHIDAPRNLATAQRALGQPQAARATIERALRSAPDDAGLKASLAALCEYFGEHERVLEILAPRAVAESRDVEGLLTLTSSLQALDRADEAQSLLEYALAVSPAGARFRIEFALAALHDRAGDYDRAFAHAERANAGKNARFDPDAYRVHVDAVIRGVEHLRAAPPVGGGSDSHRPVFIVGMPRSGTSLIEQIVAAHPSVAGAGELGDIMLLAQTAGENPRAGGSQELPAAEIERLAQAYLGTLDRVDAQAARVTDKMWENFEYLGFIERLFPRARVIHCVRDPFDVAVSCYFQHFAGANGVAFAYDLAHIGAFYRDYHRLMAFWRKVSRLAWLDLEYEDVVRDFDGQARRTIDFLGLDWSDACLSFHASGRTVNTASYAQVRRPIYASSVGRWRHYARHLAPFAQAAGLDMPE